MRDRTHKQTSAQRVVVADTARIIRARLRAARQFVDPTLNDIAGNRRGLKTADQLAALAETMLEGGYTEQEAASALAVMTQRIVDVVARQRAS